MNPSSKSPREFEPRFDWVHHDDSHVLIVHLLGFRSNQLKVQVTSTGKLRIAGDRILGSGKQLRFQKEFEVPTDVDTDKVSARFEDGVLYVRQPKKAIAPASHEQTKPKEETKPPAESPRTAGKPTADAQSVRENAAKSVHDKPKPQANGKRTTIAPKPQEPAKPKEETKPPLQNQKTAENSSAGAQSVQETASKNSIGTQDKPKSQTNGEDASEKTEKKEKTASEAKTEEEGKKRDGAFEEKMEEKLTGDKGVTGKLIGGGEIRRGEDYKQVVEAMVKEWRNKMGSLALGAAVFVIFYLVFGRNAEMDAEL